MNWLELILLIHILILHPLFASDDICLPHQYLEDGICVDCSQCTGVKNIVLRSCGVHTNTVCGTIDDLPTLPGFPQLSRNKIDSKLNNLVLSTSKNSTSASFEEDDSYDYDDDENNNDDSYQDISSSSSSSSTTSTTEANIKYFKKDKFIPEKLRPNEQNVFQDDYLELTPTKILTSNDKNGRHVKKDLSMLDNSTNITYYTDSTLEYDTTKIKEPAVPKKTTKSKSKKQQLINSHLMAIGDTKFVINGQEPQTGTSGSSKDQFFGKDQVFAIMKQHMGSDQMFLDVGGKELLSEIEQKGSTLFSGSDLQSKKTKPTMKQDPKEAKESTWSGHLATTNHSESEERVQQLIGKISGVLSNHSSLSAGREVTSKEDSDILGNSMLKNLLKNNMDNYDDDDSDDDDDYDDDGYENEDLDDDDDDDDEDNEDDDDDDDDDDAGGDDDYYDSSEKKSKFPPFGIKTKLTEDDETEKLEDDYDYNGLEDETSKDMMDSVSVANEVNVKPYSVGNDWPLLTLVSTASACLLFFIVVNVYLCIYMKRWNNKSNFEPDVEDLSVRINLMQPNGFDAVDDPSTVKHYVPNFKGITTINEKMPNLSKNIG